MEEFLKKSLNFKAVKGTNQFGFGGISQGQTFVVDDNQKIFVKQNSDPVVSSFFRIFVESSKCI